MSVHTGFVAGSSRSHSPFNHKRSPSCSFKVSIQECHDKFIFTLKWYPLPNKPLHFSQTRLLFLLRSILQSNLSLRSTTDPTSRSRPDCFPNQILPIPPHTFLLLSTLLHPAFPISLFSSPLPATLSSLYVHPLSDPTHSEEPLAQPRTPPTLNYGFACFSNIHHLFLLHTSPSSLHLSSSTKPY